MTIRAILNFGPALALLAGLSACSTERSPQESLPPADVQSFTASAAESPQEYSFSGNVEGIRRVTLSTKLMGRITDLPVDIGSRVAAGQIVVKLDRSDLAAKRAQANAGAQEAGASHRNAELQYERIKNLFATQSASKKEMDDAEMMYRMSAARVQAASEMKNEIDDALTYGELRSPISGAVVGRMVQQGDVAAPGMPLVVIEDASAFTVVARVPESEIALCEAGDPVRIQIDAVPGDFEGTVAQINPSGDPSSRQFTMKIRFSGSPDPARLRSGMHARVRIVKGTIPAILVPKRALLRRGELEGLFVLGEAGTALLRWVRTGTHVGDSVEILSGLRAGETVLLPGAATLKDGQRVKVSQ